MCSDHILCANFVMGQHIVISFVSNAFLNHKNVFLALGISVLSDMQSEIINFLFSAAILDAILNISTNNLLSYCPNISK